MARIRLWDGMGYRMENPGLGGGSNINININIYIYIYICCVHIFTPTEIINLEDFFVAI